MEIIWQRMQSHSDYNFIKKNTQQKKPQNRFKSSLSGFCISYLMCISLGLSELCLSLAYDFYFLFLAKRKED